MEIVPERVLVILDEAYFEYAEHIENYPDSMSYRFDNVITLSDVSFVICLPLRIELASANYAP